MNKILKAIIDIETMIINMEDAMCETKSARVGEYYRQKVECLDIAIEILKKEISQKPKFDNDEIWHCPRCRIRYNLEVDGNIAYCPSCGQKLDWGKE